MRALDGQMDQSQPLLSPLLTLKGRLSSHYWEGLSFNTKSIRQEARIKLWEGYEVNG